MNDLLETLNRIPFVRTQKFLIFNFPFKLESSLNK